MEQEEQDCYSVISICAWFCAASQKRLQGHDFSPAVSGQGKSAESVQCCKPHIVYGRGGFDGSHTGERGVHEHEKRCGFFAGQQAESL